MLRSLRVQSAFAWGNAWRRSRSSEFSPLEYSTFNNLCIAFHLATVCPTEKAGEPILGEYSNLGMYKRMHAGIDAPHSH